MVTMSYSPIRFARFQIKWKQLTSHFFVAIVATLVNLSPLDARANIEFYRVGKRIGYNQINNNQPMTPAGMDAGVDMFASDPSDFTSARVFSTSPSHPSPVSPFVLSQFSPGYWGSSQSYPSVSAMDINLPPGDTFGFLIEGGILGPQLALVTLPLDNLFAPQIPYFTNNAFTQLNSMNSNAPFTFTWNGYTPLAGVNDSPIFFNVYRVSDGQSMAGTVVSNTVTSYQIPANTLEPNVTYRAALDYSSRQNTIDAGFSAADSGVTFDLVTELQFTTAAPQVVTLPGDYNNNDSVDAADYVLWRRYNNTAVTLANDSTPGTNPTDYDVWRGRFGQMAGSGLGVSSNAAVPEPDACVLLMFAAAGSCLRRRRVA